MDKKLLAFFEERTNRAGSELCWNWIGSVNKKTGYGEGSPSRKKKYFAHRLSYELFVGNIPAGLHIDHICRNRKCVNPAHLRLLTIKENVLCGIGITAENSRKECCPHGHKYEGDNLYIKPTGARVCKECRRQRDREKRLLKSSRSEESMKKRTAGLKGVGK